MKKIFKIQGMHCASCASNIEKAVKKLNGVREANVNFATKKLYTEGNVDNGEIIRAVSRVGDYKATSENGEKKEKSETIKVFLVKGLDNPHCAMTIERALKKIGVEKVELNINT